MGIYKSVQVEASQMALQRCTMRTRPVLLAVLLVCLQEVVALKCYSCTEVTNENCDLSDKKTRNIHLENLPDEICPGNYTCVVHKQPYTASGSGKRDRRVTNTIRGCKSLNYCDKVREFSKSCSSCDVDLCNGSPMFTVNVLAWVICLVFVTMF